MGCPAEELVQAYLDGKAQLDERAAIEQHVMGCSTCRELLVLARTGDSGPPGAAGARRGERVDRFVIDGVLGAGAMGVVYAAHDPELDRRVALKLLRDESHGRRERLAREAQALARVADPNVCAVYELGTHDGRLFIAMELIEGQTLGSWLRAQPRGWRDVVAVFAAAGRGLAAAHGAGVIHRDFKPDNVLVGSDRRVRVTDFGLAAWLPEVAPSPSPSPSVATDLTRSGTLLGTPLYMAPEQHAGKPADERSDQWSFAAALYEAFHGQLPFSGHSLDELGRQKSAAAIRPPPPGSRVPRWLDRLVRRGLAPRPEDRWPSMAAVVEALERRRSRRWLAWSASALGAAALAAAITVRVRPQDSGADAARLAALAEAMEASLRIEHLAPPHDLRPALARIKAEVERLRPEAAQGGAASFALGKGLELLGDDDGARTAYQQAWTAGFQLPRVADGLGTVLSNLYQREYAKARGSLAGPTLDRRLAALDAELAVPAMRYLVTGGGEPWRIDLHRAEIALLTHDVATARAAAARVLAVDPGRYEAFVVQAQSWRDESNALPVKQVEPRAQLLGRALEAAEAAARYARSDQQVALRCIELRWMLVDDLLRRGTASPEALTALMTAIDEAAVLDPDAPELLVSRSRVLKMRGLDAQHTVATSAGASFEEAIRLLRRAAELDGGQVNTLEELAGNINQYTGAGYRGGDDRALVLIDEGLRALDRARAREPNDPEIYANAQRLHYERAWVVKRQHHRAQYFDELRAAVAAGQQAVRLGHRWAAATEVETGQQLELLSTDAWENGRDPRPEALQGVALAEAGHVQLKDDLRATAIRAVMLGELANCLLRVGDDPSRWLDQARKLLDDVLVGRPDFAIFQVYRGWLTLTEAQYRVAAGQDPSALLAEARRRLAPSVPNSGDDQGKAMIVEIDLLAAHWSTLHGSDSSRLLRSAEAGIQDGAQRHAAWVDELEAQCALEAALWAHRTHRPAEPDARRGLAVLDKLLPDQARDPALWVEKAELQVLAGDRAAARDSLDHAVALNPLVRNARPSFAEAEALLAP